jgi:putative flippase GtrA
MLPDAHAFGLNPRCIVFTAAVALSLALPHHLPVSKPILGTVGAFVGGVLMVFVYHGYWVYRRRKTAPQTHTAFTVYASVQYGLMLGLLFWMGATKTTPLGLLILFGTMAGAAAYCLVAWIDEVSLHLAQKDRMQYALCYGEIAKPSASAEPFL